MNEVLKRVALFTRDLLAYDEQLIRIGRQNFQRNEFETGYIVVDGLGSMARTASMEEYDGELEEMYIGGVWRGPVTLDFYGNGAYSRALEYALRMRSQTALELKQSLGIEIHQPSGITDVKQLTGQQYGERVQLEMTVEYSDDVTIDTLRIDEAQLEIRTEEGIENG